MPEACGSDSDLGFGFGFGNGVGWRFLVLGVGKGGPGDRSWNPADSVVRDYRWEGARLDQGEHLRLPDAAVWIGPCWVDRGIPMGAKGFCHRLILIYGVTLYRSVVQC